MIVRDPQRGVTHHEHTHPLARRMRHEQSPAPLFD